VVVVAVAVAIVVEVAVVVVVVVAVAIAVAVAVVVAVAIAVAVALSDGRASQLFAPPRLVMAASLGQAITENARIALTCARPTVGCMS